MTHKITIAQHIAIMALGQVGEIQMDVYKVCGCKKSGGGKWKRGDSQPRARFKIGTTTVPNIVFEDLFEIGYVVSDYLGRVGYGVYRCQLSDLGERHFRFHRNIRPRKGVGYVYFEDEEGS